MSADYSPAIFKIKKVNLWCPSLRLSQHLNASSYLSDSILRYFKPFVVSISINNGLRIKCSGDLNITNIVFK